MELAEYHYVYYSYEEWGRGYIGSRKCKCLPEEDVKYFGSYTDKTFKPTQKIILKSDYTTREEAYADEIILQNYYKVVENSHFANRSYQTSTSFSTYGLKLQHSEEHKRKISQALKSKSHSEETKRKMRGRSHSEEVRKKISKAIKGRKLTREHKRKISESNKGKSKTITEKSKQSVIKRALARTGVPGHKLTEETKRKISEATQGRIPWNKGLKGSQKSSTSKKLYYNGILYDSISSAIKITGKSHYYIKKYGDFIT